MSMCVTVKAIQYVYGRKPSVVPKSDTGFGSSGVDAIEWLTFPGEPKPELVDLLLTLQKSEAFLMGTGE